MGHCYVHFAFLFTLNKDCRRSISAILTWVPEYVKISAMCTICFVGNVIDVLVTVMPRFSFY